MNIASEIKRRKKVILDRGTDIERWQNAQQLESAWERRAILAAKLISENTTVLDIGCGQMLLERHLPSGCNYRPADLVPRDDRTFVINLNCNDIPPERLSDADLVVMLGVLEYIYEPGRIFSYIACADKSILCSYCPIDVPESIDRRALGWVNDFTQREFLELAASYGYNAIFIQSVDSLQYLFHFVRR